MEYASPFSYDWSHYDSYQVGIKKFVMPEGFYRDTYVLP
jgi:hypothetical protein